MLECTKKGFSVILILKTSCLQNNFWLRKNEFIFVYMGIPLIAENKIVITV